MEGVRVLHLSYFWPLNFVVTKEQKVYKFELYNHTRKLSNLPHSLLQLLTHFFSLAFSLKLSEYVVFYALYLSIVNISITSTRIIASYYCIVLLHCTRFIALYFDLPYSLTL